MHDPRAAFRPAAHGFLAVVRRVGADDLGRPGLGEWTIRDLVGHTGRALSTVETYLAAPVAADATLIDDPVDYYAAMLPGVTDPDRRRAVDAAVAERGREAGAALGDDPAGATAALVERVVALVDATPLDARVTTPAGVMTLAAYLPTRTLELAVHTLDLCRALGAPPPDELDAPVAATLELVGRLAARRPDRGDLLLTLLGRGGGPSAL